MGISDVLLINGNLTKTLDKLMDEKVTEQNTKIDSLDTKATEHNTKIDTVNTKVDTLDEKVTEQNTKIDSLDTKIDTLDEKIVSQNITLGSFSNKIDAQIVKLDTVNNKVEEIIGILDYIRSYSIIKVKSASYINDTEWTCSIPGGETLVATMIGGDCEFRVHYLGEYTISCAGMAKTKTVKNEAFGTIHNVQFDPYTLYGIHFSGSESDPFAKVTYLEDAVGMTPARMNFSTDKFDYGSWENAFFMPRPCMLRYDGTVDYYLDPNDYSKKEDGTPSDVANPEYEGNAMIEWGRDGKKIWSKWCADEDDETSGCFYVSDTQLDDSFHAWSFYDCEDNLGDHFYTSIYMGSLIDDKLRSISGTSVTVGKNATREMNYAKANYADKPIWATEVIADRMLITGLLTLITKSTDSQSVFGRGVSITKAAVNNGTMDNKGLFWGDQSGVNGVKLFGIENFYGNCWRRCAGYIYGNSSHKIKLTYGKADGTNAVGYNTDGSDYIVVDASSISGLNGRHIKSMTFTSEGLFPRTLEPDGSATTNYNDGCCYGNDTDAYYALFGGRWNDGYHCGSFSVDLHDSAALALSDFGAATSCKPLAV